MDLETFSASPINANELVAHRGFRGKYPENTILSITKAIEAGALFVELDVQFSEDKLPIIYHDSDLFSSQRRGNVSVSNEQSLTP